MNNNLLQIIRNELNGGKENKNTHHFLEDYGFSLLIPTFDYECLYEHMIYQIGPKVAKIRKQQKALDKKYLKIFQEMYDANKDLIEYYEVVAKAAGAFYAEHYYKAVIPTSPVLEQPNDPRVGDLLSSYDIGSTNEETKVNEAKRFLMDIVKERVLFDLIVTRGKSQIYDVSANNTNDIRLRDALATYGLMQILSNFLGNGIYLIVSFNKGILLVEDTMGKDKKLECDIEEYYNLYKRVHEEFDARKKESPVTRSLQIPQN